MECDRKILELIPVSTVLKSRIDSEYTIIASYPSLTWHYFNQNTWDFFTYIDGEKSVEEILSVLKNEYSVDEETLQNDFISFLRDLHWKNLITFKEKV